MKQPSVYLKMRVLGAIDTAPGRTRHERVQHVAAMTFLDEEGHARQFTWRTIQTWFYRYKNHGITGMTSQTRKAGPHRPDHLLPLHPQLQPARPRFGGKQPETPRLQHEIRQSTLASRHHVRPLP